jgi:thiamine-phosphate pyrophosphorylase
MSAARHIATADEPWDHDSQRDWRRLPRLLLIADGFVSGRAGLAAEAIRERIEELVAAGVRAVQLRDHGIESAAFLEVAEVLVPRLRERAPDVVIFVNGHIELTRRLGALAHVGHRGPSVEEARRQIGPEMLLSFSAHSPTDARRAAQAGADVLLVSPLFRTLSHPVGTPGEVVLLQRTVAALAEANLHPGLYALGGVTPDHVAQCLQAGAHGVAVLSGLLEAADPTEAARAYLSATHRAQQLDLPLHTNRPYDSGE